MTGSKRQTGLSPQDGRAGDDKAAVAMGIVIPIKPVCQICVISYFKLPSLSTVTSIIGPSSSQIHSMPCICEKCGRLVAHPPGRRPECVPSVPIPPGRILHTWKPWETHWSEAFIKWISLSEKSSVTVQPEVQQWQKDR